MSGGVDATNQLAFRGPLFRSLPPYTALAAALIVHGVWSAPAPPSLGSAQVAIGFLLMVAAGWSRILAVFSGALLLHRRLRLWEAVGCLCFVWLLWVPLLRGVGVDWAVKDILRDVVPLGFLFLPLFLGESERRQDASGCAGLVVPLLCLALAGALFSLRWWQDIGWMTEAIGQESVTAGYRHLLTSPAVLFGAVFFTMMVLTGLTGSDQLAFRPRFVRRIGIAGGASIGAVLCWGALAATVHRFALAAGGLAVVGLMVIAARRAPARLLAILVFGLCLWLVFAIPIVGVLSQIVLKSQAVGSNQRVAELSAVAESLQQDWSNLLFGLGWGALLDNPALGGQTVSFTHNLVGYMLLKSGLLGCGAVILYLTVLLAGPLCRLLANNLSLLLVLLPCLISGLFLHTGFKSLTFGVLLWLCRAAATPGLDRSEGRDSRPAINFGSWR